MEAQNTDRLEVPWEDDSKWAELELAPFRSDYYTGKAPEGTDYLSNLRDGQRFWDSSGASFRKACDGPVQSAVTITDGHYFAQWDTETIVATVEPTQ